VKWDRGLNLSLCCSTGADEREDCVRAEFGAGCECHLSPTGKVLPQEFAKDTDRIARFQREAKLLASLNHPNIAAIHGLEESGGTNFLVLELVEGQTLADRIKIKLDSNV
jgi:serine/threonine protein kinase